jgi:alternate signal-mediated exported protein
MNRITKAAMAMGAGAVLLVGGAGSLAYWSGSAQATSGATLNTGTLQASNGTCGGWTWLKGMTLATGAPVATPIIPGQSVQMVCTVTINGQGQDLRVTASFNSPTWTLAKFNGVVNLTTSAAVVTRSSPTPAGPVATVSPAPASGVFAVNGSYSVAVTVTADFPYGDSGTVSNNATMNLNDALSAVVLTFVQVNPTATP